MTGESKQPFADAAGYYHLRAPYPHQAFEYLRQEFQLDKGTRVLDLGCGPGTIAIPISQMVGSVVALDPCEEMIEEGCTHARSIGCDNIAWSCMRAEDIAEELGLFRVATIGQAFHWMERDLVLHKLQRMLEEEQGGLVLINPGKRRPQESWEEIASQVIGRYLGVRGRHASMQAEPEHEPALRRSGVFARFTSREFAMSLQRDVSSIVGYVYSISTSSKLAFGDRVPQFEQELTEALLSANPSGIFHEHVETEVLIARLARI